MSLLPFVFKEVKLTSIHPYFAWTIHNSHFGRRGITTSSVNVAAYSVKCYVANCNFLLFLQASKVGMNLFTHCIWINFRAFRRRPGSLKKWKLHLQILPDEYTPFLSALLIFRRLLKFPGFSTDYLRKYYLNYNFSIIGRCSFITLINFLWKC